MRFILRILSGTQAGRKVLLDPNQIVQVGRTSWADIALSDDAQLSDVHFQLRTDAVACYLRDIDSLNGTLVNNEAVTETVLRNGDEIRAGGTRFAVELEGDQPDKAALSAATLPKPLPRDVASGQNASFVMTQAASGLQRFSGQCGGHAPAQLASLLSQTAPMMLIADFHRISVPAPADERTEYLYDWLAPTVQESVSPMLLDSAWQDNWPLIVEDGWGNDAVICCFTRQPFDRFAAALREIGRVSGDETNPKAAESIMGIGWPKVLGAILDSKDTRSVDLWSAAVEFALIEDPQDPQSWNIFGPPSLADILGKAGLANVTPAEQDLPVAEPR